MEYIKNFRRFVHESGTEELFWKCVGWIKDHYYIVGSGVLIGLAMSTGAWFLSAPAFTAVFVFVLVVLLSTSAAYFVFGPTSRNGSLSGQTGPLKMVGVIEESQISLWAHLDLQVSIAVRFENSDIAQRFIRGFSASLITRGGLKEKLTRPSLVETVPESIVTLENGYAIQPGISPLYYLEFSVPSFVKDEQTFEIEMEALGQSPQRIEIVPNWSNVQPLLLYEHTVKKIRDLN